MAEAEGWRVPEAVVIVRVASLALSPLINLSFAILVLLNPSLYSSLARPLGSCV